MAEPQSGWICLHRQIKSHWLWPGVKGRRYSKFEAWVYLLLSANHQARKIDIGSKLIIVGRGQLLTSQAALARRWSWHRETVSQFLYQLKADEMLGIETSKHTSTGFTLLTICNYSKYQGGKEQASDIQPTSKSQNPDIPTDIETDIHSPGITTENINGNLNQDIQHPASEPASEPASNFQKTSTNNNGKSKNKNKCAFPIFPSGNGASGLTPAESFEVFYQAYPRKRSKGKAWKAWLKMRPGEELLNTMLAAIGRAKESHDWQKEAGQIIPYPASWLNSQGWEDEVEEVKEPYYGPTYYDCGKCHDVHEEGETCEAV